MISRTRHARDRTRPEIRRAEIRREVEAVAAGRKTLLSLTADDDGVEVARAVQRFARRLPLEAIERRRLAAAMERAGVASAALDRLASDNWSERIAAVQIVGALGLEAAVPWLGVLLGTGHDVLIEPAARALGRIGGWRSAEALVAGVRRSGPRRIFVTQIARAAPDLFVEAGLSRSGRQVVLNALALAAGLRRRHAAVGPLTALLLHGNRAQRVISCRSLGWIGAMTAVPLLTAALADREWQVRMSAAKALGALRARESRTDLESLLADPNPRVREAARLAVRRLGGG